MTLLRLLYLNALIFGVTMGVCSCQSHSKDPAAECTTDIYDIREVKDTSAWRTVIGFEFYCDSATFIKRIDLNKDYPWKTDCYSILPFDNPYLKHASAEHYQSSILQGFIPLQLNNARWKDVKKCFSLTSTLQIDSFYIKLAKIDTRYLLASSELLILSHYLMLFAGQDAAQTSHLTYFFPEGQLKVYNAKGDTIYSITRANSVFQDAVVDTFHQHLCFKTSYLDEHTRKYGWEIHDMVKDSMLFSFEADTMFGLIKPKTFGEFVVFEIQKKYLDQGGVLTGYVTHQTYVFDASRQKMLKYEAPEDYSFSFDRMTNDRLIYIKGNDETEPVEYDTVHISRFVPY